MARSLLNQLEQIRRSETYDDDIFNINDPSVAETSTTLEEDLDNIRTLMRQTRGGGKWYTALGTYFDPTDTSTTGSLTKSLSLLSIKGYTTDAQTVLLSVVSDDAGSNYTVNGTDQGVLLNSNNADLNIFDYATAADRRGLPIFSSTGIYWDEGAEDKIAKVDVLSSGDTRLENTSGHIIYAKLHDGSDNGGSGDGTDVWVQFYANDSITDLQDVVVGSGTLGSDSISLYFIAPERRVMADVEDWEWMRTLFVQSWAGAGGSIGSSDVDLSGISFNT